MKYIWSGFAYELVSVLILAGSLALAYNYCTP